MEAAKRNLSFEMIRIFAMVLIVLSHVISRIPWNLQESSGYRRALAVGVHDFTGQVGVCLFFMVTGYFMVTKSFNFSRIVKVAIQTWCYALLCFVIWGVLYVILPAVRDITTFRQLIVHAYTSICPILSSAYWFVTAYLVLLVFSPALNLIVKHLSSSMLVAMILLMLVFSVTPLFSFELYWNNFTYAVTCYLLGSCIRQYGVDERFRSVISAPALIGIWAVCLLLLIAFVYIAEQLGVWDKFVFNSGDRSVRGTIPMLEIIPATVLIARVHIARPFSLPLKWERLARTIASHTFGIYLLHTNTPLISYLVWNGLLTFVPLPESMLMVSFEILLIAVSVFTISLLCSIVIDDYITGPVHSFVLQLLNNFKQRCKTKG